MTVTAQPVDPSATHVQKPLKSAADLSHNRQKLLAKTIKAIRESKSIQDIFDKTTQGLQVLIKADRVAIYRFNADWSGQFVADAYGEGQSSLLVEQNRFPEIQKNVSDCSAKLLGIEPESSGEVDAADTYLQENEGGVFTRRGIIRVCNDIYNAGFSDCYIDILEKYEAKAYVIGALHSGDKLWGLLSAYQSDGPREWTEEEAELLEQVSIHLGVALQQAEATLRIQQQTAALKKAADLQKALSRTINKIRQSLDIQEIFDTATQEVRQLLSTDRVAIYRLNSDWSGKFVAEAYAGQWSSLLQDQSTFPEIVKNVSTCAPSLLNLKGPADTYLQETDGALFDQSRSVRVCNDIYAAGFEECYVQTLEKYDARAYIISSLYSGEKIWGLIAAFQNDGPRQWTEEETEILNQISNQLGVALKQANALEKVSQQAADLKKAAVRQESLAKTIEKIRQSLDINDIFKTTTQEVRQLLGVERVAIYRFNENWSGSFVADSMMDGWQFSMPSETVIESVLSRSDKAGQYPRNEVFVPIIQGEKLWGLLMAYQNSTPRYWDNAEVALLSQVSAQLAIALQQADLLTQTRTQAEQLNQALQDLQRTQAQMVQGEKMAGLGQLMAGIAHEINNPVSFVFSNAQPAEEHVTDVIELLKLYQQHYPNPHESIAEKADEIEIDFVEKDLPKLIGSMKMGATRIRDIVQSMRVFSRMDEVAFKPVDIHQGIDSTLLILGHRLKAEAQRKAIEVKKDYGKLPPVSCYAGQLNQVFMNLLSNAIDALSEDLSGDNQEGKQPQIRITTEWLESRECVCIQIEDNGSGIPEASLPNIFNPFFTTKPVGEGTGLGLSISYQIVTEVHHGKLECFSDAASGTSFRIEIPVSQDS